MNILCISCLKVNSQIVKFGWINYEVLRSEKCHCFHSLQFYMNLCRIGTLIIFQSYYFLTPLEVKCLNFFWFLILQFNENFPLSLKLSWWLCFTLYPVCHSRLRRRKHWATPLLIGCGPPARSYADNADSTEMIKDLGNLWEAEHRILNVWTSCQNFIVIRNWTKKKECGRISTRFIFLRFLNELKSLRRLKNFKFPWEKNINLWSILGSGPLCDVLGINYTWASTTLSSFSWSIVTFILKFFAPLVQIL